MNEVSELQRRRAENIIWNAAGDHSFSPDFKAYDGEAKAELYWNTVIGAVRRHYDYKKLEKVFSAFQQYEDQELYDGLLWLGLENAVFEREVRDRPALEVLRREYAARFLADYPLPPEPGLYDAMAYAHFSRILGRDDRLDAYGKKLLDELEFSSDLSTGEVVERTKELFERWLQIRTEEVKRAKRGKLRIPGVRKNKSLKGKLHKFGLGFTEHPVNAYGGSATGAQVDEDAAVSKMSAAELRVFMETKFGKSAFDRTETMMLERAVCTGNHSACHVLVTVGEKGNGKIQNGFEALQREREAKQIQRNRAFYNNNISARRTAIDMLAGKIQNSVLLHLQPTRVRANAGELEGGRAWRAVYLNDERVFSRNDQNESGDLCVDILLDASTSQKARQEILSNQGYIIAESLNRCNIPCRVMSFCSMTGYTILRIFRGYFERNANDRIFEYVSNGCNRDGLAVRIAHHLICKESFEHKILIILSDAKPNDICRMKLKGSDEYVNYETMNGIRDTAFEVRSAKADGISVICVFTGDDEDVAAAKLIYGRDFARIQSMDKLAETVGMLIQNQIKIM